VLILFSYFWFSVLYPHFFPQIGRGREKKISLCFCFFFFSFFFNWVRAYGTPLMGAGDDRRSRFCLPSIGTLSRLFSTALPGNEAPFAWQNNGT
jgi:hypothetical protein